MSNNQLVQRELNIKTMLANKSKMIQSILGDKKKSDNFTATALQIALNPDLKDCTEESIINCLVGAAMLDLNPDKNIGQVYIYKYGAVATLDVGYKGYLTIYQRAGYEIRTFPVFMCDDFSVSFDGWEMVYTLNPGLEHRDLGNFEWEYENLKGILVVSKDLLTGEFKRDFIPQKVIENMRLSNPNQKPNQYDKDAIIIQRKKDKNPVGVWHIWYIDMCSKSAIKKFKNQLAIRNKEDLITIVDMLDNHKSIDFERTKEEGIIIEGQVEAKKEIQKPKDINSLNLPLKQEIQEQLDIDIEVTPVAKAQKTPKEIMIQELIDRGATAEEAGKWCYNKGDDVFNSYLNDPASIDSILEEIRGF